MEDYSIYITTGFISLAWLTGIALLYRYSNTIQLLRRTMALLIGLIGLALLIIQPKYLQHQSPIQAHIGTPTQSGKDSLAFYFDNVHDLISDINYHRFDSIIIHGSSIKSEDLELITDIPIRWQKLDPIMGINSIIPNRYYVNEESQLKGRFCGDIENILLQAPDSSRYPAAVSDGHFDILWTPKISGDFIFDLIAITSTEDTIVERLPLHIYPETQWNLLALLSYPSAEFNQMKNYWSQLGHGVAARTQIARERYASSYSNIEKYDLSNLNNRLLSKFDLVILQGQEWNQMNESERNRILYQVSNKGLGLLLLQQEVDQKFYLINNPKTSEIKIKRFNSTPLKSPLQALDLQPKSGWTNIRLNNHVVSSVKNYGLGKIQIFGLNDTYKLKLEGLQKIYQQIWSQVLSAIFTDFNTENSLIKPTWIKSGLNQEFQLLLDQEDENLIIDHNGTALEYLKTPNIPGHLTLHVRPQPGRNTFSIKDSDEEFSYFAHAPDTWNAMRAKDLALQIEQHQQLPKRELSDLSEKKPYSFFWWFALFIIGFGILWLDERVFQ